MSILNKLLLSSISIIDDSDNLSSFDDDFVSDSSDSSFDDDSSLKLSSDISSSDDSLVDSSLCGGFFLSFLSKNLDILS